MNKKIEELVSKLSYGECSKKISDDITITNYCFTDESNELIYTIFANKLINLDDFDKVINKVGDYKLNIAYINAIKKYNQNNVRSINIDKRLEYFRSTYINKVSIDIQLLIIELEDLIFINKYCMRNIEFFINKIIKEKNVSYAKYVLEDSKYDNINKNTNLVDKLQDVIIYNASINDAFAYIKSNITFSDLIDPDEHTIIWKLFDRVNNSNNALEILKFMSLYPSYTSLIKFRIQLEYALIKTDDLKNIMRYLNEFNVLNVDLFKNYLLIKQQELENSIRLKDKFNKIKYQRAIQKNLIKLNPTVEIINVDVLVNGGYKELNYSKKLKKAYQNYFKGE